MGDNSKISWTDASWNPTTGCSVVSPGCEHCYAESLSLRMGWSKKPWTAINAAENVVLHPDRLDLPLRWQKPRMIFVNSMSDLFHEQVPDGFIDRVFATMENATQHTYQVLTKRPARMRSYVADTFRGTKDGLEHIWLGTSVEDQRRANERIPELLAIDWPVRFLSCEPLLGPVDLTPWLPYYTACGASRDPETVAALDDLFRAAVKKMGGASLHWVIDGGESGPGFRPAEEDWYRAIRDACVAAGVPYFHKQGNAFKSGQYTLLDGREWHEFPFATDGENRSHTFGTLKASADRRDRA